MEASAQEAEEAAAPLFRWWSKQARACSNAPATYASARNVRTASLLFFAVEQTGKAAARSAMAKDASDDMEIGCDTTDAFTALNHRQSDRSGIGTGPVLYNIHYSCSRHNIPNDGIPLNYGSDLGIPVLVEPLCL